MIMSRIKKKFYVVWEGRATGVFDSWEECQLQVEGYPGAKFKGFNTAQEAVEAFRGDPTAQMDLLRNIATYSAPVVNYESIPQIKLDAIAVDAACSRNPGPVEYRGVWVRTGQELFRVGPFAGGTNNIGEFCALIHALALCERKGRTDIPIYSDSRTAQAWLRNGAVKTSLTPTAENAQLRSVLERAVRWMQTHPVINPILKWNTDEWGEIPADFGRK